MSVIDDYLKNVPDAQRVELERVRKIIRQIVPEADEVMTYGMPGFKYKGKYLVAFGAFKDHLSIFPGSTPTEVLKDTLKNFKTSKGTIQFTLDNPLPESTLREIIELCAQGVHYNLP